MSCDDCSSITATRAALIEEIIAAFPAERPFPFDPLVNSSQSEEPLDTEDAFRDKSDWTALDGTWVDQAANGWCSALIFLADEPACFYLPAYLVADLRGQLKTSDPVFNLAHLFTIDVRNQCLSRKVKRSWADYGRNRWRHLTSKQILAVIHYLEWRRVIDEDNVDGGIEEALSYYWYKRLRDA